LVADDNATNRFILREMLDSWNCRLTEAADGREALSAISLSFSDPYACVIMDMHMPGMDGLEAAKAIRRDSRHKDLPLILLSSSGFTPENIEAATLFSAVLTKPVRTSPLFNALTVVTGIASVPESPLTEIEIAESQPLKDVKILVVEDNAINQLVVIELLRAWGCTVVAVDNGALAVEVFKREKFDVILMDVQMPVMDGFEATAAIRTLEMASGTHTDIIAMTANAMTGDREKCLRAGMDSYLAKPLQPPLLLEKLAKSAGRFMVGMAPSKSAEPSLVPSFDVERLNESCSGNKELKLKVIERYLATSLDSLAQISLAVASGDRNAAKSAAHALKGSSVTVGSAQIGEMCAELEIMAVSPSFGPEKLVVAEELSRELGRVHSALKAYSEQLAREEV
jgi:CheY-like chemotaxis protein/HPt (histidine-containing phosphotransfer) domain-containing protein